MAVRFSVAVIGLKGGNAISHSNQSTPHNNLLSKTHWEWINQRIKPTRTYFLDSAMKEKTFKDYAYSPTCVHNKTDFVPTYKNPNKQTSAPRLIFIYSLWSNLSKCSKLYGMQSVFRRQIFTLIWAHIQYRVPSNQAKNTIILIPETEFC